MMTADLDVQRRTKEVVYAVCEGCRLRIEVNFDASPCGQSVLSLYNLVRRHITAEHPELGFLTYRELQLMAKTEEIDLDLELDISDIISVRSLRAIALRLASLGRFSTPLRAHAALKARVIELAATSAYYSCRECGRRITRKAAVNGGIGVRHR